MRTSQPAGLDGVLEGEPVDHGGEHAGVVGGGLGHAEFAGEPAAEEVAAADDDADLDAAVTALDDLTGDVVEGLGVDAGVSLSLERLAGDLEDDSGCGGRIGHGACAIRANSITDRYSPIS